ncbi:hypothetical protein Pyn_13494 [Prunus yedoensis var. nudiflora]|uniref:Uncharacterized protein n=1 Tax=Prunus yedoensis var. nudiflora TaxID=2094558 RepID=A0A314UI99_PRUYE|nr:hypothetical protein Pyn_13494 [Prunus yedoensis var. nudiflora]
MERQAFETNSIETMQRHPWFMGLKNPQDQHMRVGVGGGDEMIMPFWGQNHINAIWSNNAFFP